MSNSRRLRSPLVWERVRSRLDEVMDEWMPRTTAKQLLTGSLPQRQLAIELKATR